MSIQQEFTALTAAIIAIINNVGSAIIGPHIGAWGTCPSMLFAAKRPCVQAFYGVWVAEPVTTGSQSSADKTVSMMCDYIQDIFLNVQLPAIEGAASASVTGAQVCGTFNGTADAGQVVLQSDGSAQHGFLTGNTDGTHDGTSTADAAAVAAAASKPSAAYKQGAAVGCVSSLTVNLGGSSACDFGTHALHMVQAVCKLGGEHPANMGHQKAMNEAEFTARAKVSAHGINAMIYIPAFGSGSSTYNAFPVGAAPYTGIKFSVAVKKIAGTDGLVTSTTGFFKNVPSKHSCVDTVSSLNWTYPLTNIYFEAIMVGVAEKEMLAAVCVQLPTVQWTSKKVTSATNGQVHNMKSTKAVQARFSHVCPSGGDFQHTGLQGNVSTLQQINGNQMNAVYGGIATAIKNGVTAASAVDVFYSSCKDTTASQSGAGAMAEGKYDGSTITSVISSAMEGGDLHVVIKYGSHIMFCDLVANHVFF